MSGHPTHDLYILNPHIFKIAAVLVEKATGKSTTFCYVNPDAADALQYLIGGGRDNKEYVRLVMKALKKPTRLFIVTHDYRIFSYTYCINMEYMNCGVFNTLRPRRIITMGDANLEGADLSQVELDPDSDIEVVVGASFLTIGDDEITRTYYCRTQPASMPAQIPARDIISVHGANIPMATEEYQKVEHPLITVMHAPCTDNTSNDALIPEVGILREFLKRSMDINHFVDAVAQLPLPPRPLFYRGIPSKISDVDIFTD
jgi:hypothetical protein